MSDLAVGIDFGTTNSALAVVGGDGEPLLEGPLRSILQKFRHEFEAKLADAPQPAASAAEAS